MTYCKCGHSKDKHSSSEHGDYCWECPCTKFRKTLSAKWYWCPSIEKSPDFGFGRNNFGLCFFAFGCRIWFGKRTWAIRIAVPR